MFEIQYTNNDWKDIYPVAFRNTQIQAEEYIWNRKESYNKLDMNNLPLFTLLPSEHWQIVYIPDGKNEIIKKR